MRRFFLLALLVMCTVIAAPTLVSRTALRNTLLGMALPSSGWRIESQSALFGWTGTQSLYGVSIFDPEGNPLFIAESINCDRSLLALIADQTDLGKIRLQQPTVYLVTHPEGSNVEDLLTELVPEEKASSETQSTLVVEIIEGIVHGLDSTTQQKWSLAGTNVIANLQGDISGSAKIEVAQSGDLSQFKFKLHKMESGGQQLDLLAERLPLHVLQPWLARAIPGAQLTGSLTIDAPQLRWSMDPQRGLLLQTKGRIEVQDFAFTSAAFQGDTLVSQQIQVPWQLSIADDQISIEHMEVVSDWSKINAQGTLSLSELVAWDTNNLPQGNTSVVGEVALNRLAAMLPHTLQLREDVQIDTGQLTFQAGNQPSKPGLAWTASVEIQDLAGRHRGQPIHLQPVHGQVVLAGSFQSPRIEHLSINAPFAEALFSTDQDTVAGDIQLDLDAFTHELGQFVDFGTWQFAGQAQLHAELQLMDNTLHLHSSAGTINNLRVQSDTLSIDEPRVQFSGKIVWDKVAQNFSSQEFQLSGSTLTFITRDIALNQADDGSFTASGRMAFNANLERVVSALKLSAQAKSLWPRGLAQGQIQLVSNQGMVQANLSATTKQLQIMQNQGASRPELLWSEPNLQLLGTASYEMDADRLQFQNIQLLGQTIQLSGLAGIEQISSAQKIQAHGKVQYDAQALSRLLMKFLGPDVQLQGDRLVHFQVAGQLPQSDGTGSLQDWKVSADAGWSAASLYGLAVGAGKLQGILDKGHLQIAPLDLDVGQGKLTARPQIRLARGAEHLFIPSGPLLTRVQISPQVSDTMLKYIAPVVAGATRTTGDFSIALNDSQIPFTNPEQAQAEGRLTIHHLRIAPGPILHELEVLVRQLKNLSKSKQFLAVAASPRGSSALTVTERNIDFRVDQGRVYHRELEFEIDDVPIRSRGSVGFDQSLALVFEITLQEKWLGKHLRSLAGQAVQIPVQGTFENPKLDSRAISDLLSHFVQEAATQVIGDEVNRQLEKLFRGR